MEIQLTFPAASSGEATVLARDLRTDLIEEGIDADSLALKRLHAEHMDIGSSISMVIEVLSIAHASYDIAKVILNFARRTQSPIRVRSSGGDVEFNTDRAGPTDLAKFLQSLAEK